MKTVVDFAVEPGEGSWEAREAVRITSSQFRFSEPPYVVTLAGVKARVVSVKADEIIVRTGRPETVTCAPISGPTEVLEIATGLRLTGPDWTYLPPDSCAPLPTLCEPLGSRLCLHGDRFGIEVDWTDFAGNSGPGRLALTSETSGLFWFFSPDNWEMHVKLLEVCGGNDQYWLFSAASTTVEFDLRVTDYYPGGTTKIYSNESGNPAIPVTDTSAFSCLSPGFLYFQVWPHTIPREGYDIELLALVVDSQGTAVPGVTVAFESELGTFQPGTQGVAETALSGEALEILTVTEADIDGHEGDTFSASATLLVDGQPISHEFTIRILR